MNYFEYFGLPVSPRIDRSSLKRKFLTNSKEFHPDFHTLSDEATQDRALEQSTINNQGYKVLTSDDLRLKHFLEIHGVLGEEGANKVPQDFLMEIMEVNEALMELEFDDDPDARQQVASLVNDLEATLQAESSALIESYNPDEPRQQTISALADYYLKQRYLLRLKQKI